MRMRVPYLASLSGLRIQCCQELWCKSNVGLDPTLQWLWCSCSCSSDSSPSLGTSIYQGCSPKQTKKTPPKQQQNTPAWEYLYYGDWHILQGFFFLFFSSFRALIVKHLPSYPTCWVSVSSSVKWGDDNNNNLIMLGLNEIMHAKCLSLSLSNNKWAIHISYYSLSILPLKLNFE